MSNKENMDDELYSKLEKNCYTVKKIYVGCVDANGQVDVAGKRLPHMNYILI